MTQCKILVVDDNADIRELLEILLTSEGYDVTLASSGEQALQLLHPELDLVVLIGSVRDRERAERRAEGNSLSRYLLARLRGGADELAAGEDDAPATDADEADASAKDADK